MAAACRGCRCTGSQCGGLWSPRRLARRRIDNLLTELARRLRRSPSRFRAARLGDLRCGVLPARGWRCAPAASREPPRRVRVRPDWASVMYGSMYVTRQSHVGRRNPYAGRGRRTATDARDTSRVSVTQGGFDLAQLLGIAIGRDQEEVDVRLISRGQTCGKDSRQARGELSRPDRGLDDTIAERAAPGSRRTRYQTV
jgi:hypothetical protein